MTTRLVLPFNYTHGKFVYHLYQPLLSVPLNSLTASAGPRISPMYVTVKAFMSNILLTEIGSKAAFSNARISCSVGTSGGSVRQGQSDCKEITDRMLWLIVCLFWVFRSTREFFTHMECTCTCTVRHSWPLSSYRTSACHTYCDAGHPFIMVIYEDP